MTLDGLLFDMGDVLFDATSWRRWLAQLLNRMGLQARYPDFFQTWDKRFLVEVHCGRREYSDAFCAFLRSAGLTADQIDEVEAASRVRKRELEHSARPLLGVRPTLARLHSTGVIMGVLSDSESPAAELREKLVRLGLADRFQTVVSSCELGRTKPDPLCYQTAVSAMGLTMPRVAFVGHDAEELAGAAAAGMPTIAFNYEPAARADVYLERFDELLAMASPGAASALAG